MYAQMLDSDSLGTRYFQTNFFRSYITDFKTTSFTK